MRWKNVLKYSTNRLISNINLQYNIDIYRNKVYNIIKVKEENKWNREEIT